MASSRFLSMVSKFVSDLFRPQLIGGQSRLHPRSVKDLRRRWTSVVMLRGELWPGRGVTHAGGDTLAVLLIEPPPSQSLETAVESIGQLSIFRPQTKFPAEEMQYGKVTGSAQRRLGPLGYHSQNPISRLGCAAQADLKYSQNLPC